MNTPAPPTPATADADPNRPVAVALSYDGGEAAPRVVAKGYGQLADTIVRTAREHGLHVHESRELVGLLMQVDLMPIYRRNSTRRWPSCWPGCTGSKRASCPKRWRRGPEDGA